MMPPYARGEAQRREPYLGDWDEVARNNTSVQSVQDHDSEHRTLTDAEGIEATLKRNSDGRFGVSFAVTDGTIRLDQISDAHDADDGRSQLRMGDIVLSLNGIALEKTQSEEGLLHLIANSGQSVVLHVRRSNEMVHEVGLSASDYLGDLDDAPNDTRALQIRDLDTGDIITLANASELHSQLTRLPVPPARSMAPAQPLPAPARKPAAVPMLAIPSASSTASNSNSRGTSPRSSTNSSTNSIGKAGPSWAVSLVSPRGLFRMPQLSARLHPAGGGGGQSSARRPPARGGAPRSGPPASASAAVGAPALGTVLAYGQTGTPIATTVSRAMRLAKDAALAEQTGSAYQAVALYRQASRHLAMAFELVEWREAKPSPGAELLVPTKERLQHYTELYTQRAKQLETITELEAKALQPRPVSLSTPQDTEAVDAGLRLRELLRREPVAVPTENTLCDVPRLIVWMNEAKHAKVSSLVTPRGERGSGSLSARGPNGQGTAAPGSARGTGSLSARAAATPRRPLPVIKSKQDEERWADDLEAEIAELRVEEAALAAEEAALREEEAIEQQARALEKATAAAERAAAAAVKEVEKAANSAASSWVITAAAAAASAAAAAAQAAAQAAEEREMAELEREDAEIAREEATLALMESMVEAEEEEETLVQKAQRKAREKMRQKSTVQAAREARPGREASGGVPEQKGKKNEEAGSAKASEEVGFEAGLDISVGLVEAGEEAGDRQLSEWLHAAATEETKAPAATVARDNVYLGDLEEDDGLADGTKEHEEEEEEEEDEEEDEEEEVEAALAAEESALIEEEEQEDAIEQQGWLQQLARMQQEAASAGQGLLGGLAGIQEGAAKAGQGWFGGLVGIQQESAKAGQGWLEGVAGIIGSQQQARAEKDGDEGADDAGKDQQRATNSSKASDDAEQHAAAIATAELYLGDLEENDEPPVHAPTDDVSMGNLERTFGAQEEKEEPPKPQEQMESAQDVHEAQRKAREKMRQKSSSLQSVRDARPGQEASVPMPRMEEEKKKNDGQRQGRAEQKHAYARGEDKPSPYLGDWEESVQDDTSSARAVQDPNTQTGGGLTAENAAKPPAPNALKIEMPKLDIAATSDAAEPQRSARDFSAREREVAKPALASTGVAALTARGAKDKKEAAAAAGESTAPPALSLNKLSELKGRDPDAPMATPRKDAPETSRRKKAGMSDEPASTKALAATAAAEPAAATKPDGTIVQDLVSQPAASIVQDLDSQPAAVETKPPAPSALKIEMPKLDIAATSDAAEPQRSARDFSAREREVAKPALASTGVAALTARGAKNKKEAATAAAAALPPPPPPPPPPPVPTPAPAPDSASATSPRGSISRMFGFGSKPLPSAEAAATPVSSKSAAAGPVAKLTLPVADLKLSELNGRDPDAPLATPRKDAPETSRRKKVDMPVEPQSMAASSDEATKEENLIS